MSAYVVVCKERKKVLPIRVFSIIDSEYIFEYFSARVVGTSQNCYRYNCPESDNCV